MRTAILGAFLGCLASFGVLGACGGGSPSAGSTTLDARVAELEALLSAVSRDPNGDIAFTGVNVHIRSGAGSTHAPVNGKGNLLVGYDEPYTDQEKSGSHNLVVGAFHGYASSGCFIAGDRNECLGRATSITGGRDNQTQIAGEYSCICGGEGNQTRAFWSTISGGGGNQTFGERAWVGGGNQNRANGRTSAVVGGVENQSRELFACVVGGRLNIASGNASVVLGGESNTASGDKSAVGGGNLVEATIDWSFLP